MRSIKRVVIKRYTKKDLKKIPLDVVRVINIINRKLMMKEHSLMISKERMEKAVKNADELVTFFVVSEMLKGDLKFRKTHCEISLFRICSVIEEFARRYWQSRYEEFNKLIEEKCKGLRGYELDKCIKKIFEEVYPLVMEESLMMFRAYLPRSWKTKKDYLYRPRHTIHIRRKIFMPPVLSRFWDYRNFWQQFFFFRIKDEWYFTYGGSASSGERASHATITTLLVKYWNKPAKTYIFWYDDENRFWFVDKWDTLIICPYEAFGTFGMSVDEIRELRKKVNEEIPLIIFESGVIRETGPYIEIFKGGADVYI